MSGELFLQVLDTSYVVRSNDARWIDLVEVMWGPFCVPGDARRYVPIEIAHRAPGWVLCLPEADPRFISDPWELAGLLEYLLIMHSIETATSVVAVHAAVLVRDDAALLLVGKSGTGKTTLALRLIEKGWEYFSDDLAVIDRSSRRVLPFPKPLKIEDAELWEGLARSWSPPSWLPRPHGEFQVPAAAVSAIPLEAVQVSRVVFLEPAASTTSVEELHGEQPMTTARDRIRATDSKAVELVRSILDSAATFRLSFHDPQSAAESLEHLLGVNSSRHQPY